MTTATIAEPAHQNGASTVLITPLVKLRRDLRTGMATLTHAEARFLVDAYYATQDYRMQAANQLKASAAESEPHEVIGWHFEQMQAHENEIKRVLDAYTDVEPTGMGEWAKSVHGIGPVLAAGLLAHIDVTKAPTAGHVWSFAGLNPTAQWEKGQKRPWNARLKVLCWKIGESFVKVSGNDKSLYGRIYRERKDQEEARNAEGLFAEQARLAMTRKRFGEDTKAITYYRDGRLPPAHIHARATRYAMKLFLAHFWEESYRRHYKAEPPAPYPIAHMGHAHRVDAEV